MCAIFVKILRTPPFPHLKHNSEHAVPLLKSLFSSYQLPTESHSCSLAWCWRQGLNRAGRIWSYQKYACFLCFFLWSCQRVILVFPAQTVNPVLVPVPMTLLCHLGMRFLCFLHGEISSCFLSLIRKPHVHWDISDHSKMCVIFLLELPRHFIFSVLL